jgi:hypothetical protein
MRAANKVRNEIGIVNGRGEAILRELNKCPKQFFSEGTVVHLTFNTGTLYLRECRLIAYICYPKATLTQCLLNEATYLILLPKQYLVEHTRSKRLRRVLGMRKPPKMKAQAFSNFCLDFFWLGTAICSS